MQVKTFDAVVTDVAQCTFIVIVLSAYSTVILRIFLTVIAKLFLNVGERDNVDVHL